MTNNSEKIRHFAIFADQESCVQANAEVGFL